MNAREVSELVGQLSNEQRDHMLAQIELQRATAMFVGRQYDAGLCQYVEGRAKGLKVQPLTHPCRRNGRCIVRRVQ